MFCYGFLWEYSGNILTILKCRLFFRLPEEEPLSLPPLGVEDSLSDPPSGLGLAIREIANKEQD
jgi:hypothetical protein